jgi:hypothetical protein
MQTWRLSCDVWPANGRIPVVPMPLRELVAARIYQSDGSTQAIDPAAFAIDKVSAPAVLATQRAEIASDDILQRAWRPIYALELSLLECPAFALTLLHALWTGHEVSINGFASLTSLLMAYFGARFGVLAFTSVAKVRKAGVRHRPIGPI